jgi:hypothetical protein
VVDPTTSVNTIVTVFLVRTAGGYPVQPRGRADTPLMQIDVRACR